MKGSSCYCFPLSSPFTLTGSTFLFIEGDFRPLLSYVPSWICASTFLCIYILLLRHPTTAHFHSDNYLLFVLVRDEKWEFCQSLICDVRDVCAKSISVITGSLAFFGGGSRDIYWFETDSLWSSLRSKTRTYWQSSNLLLWERIFWKTNLAVMNSISELLVLFPFKTKNAAMYRVVGKAEKKKVLLYCSNVDVWMIRIVLPLHQWRDFIWSSNVPRWLGGLALSQGLLWLYVGVQCIFQS